MRPTSIAVWSRICLRILLERVAGELQSNHIVIAHGLDRLEELSLLERTVIADVHPGKMRNHEISPGTSACSSARPHPS